MHPSRTLQEKRLLQKYFDEINQDTGKYCFMVDDTLKGLDLGAVETLIVWDNLDINRWAQSILLSSLSFVLVDRKSKFVATRWLQLPESPRGRLGCAIFPRVLTFFLTDKCLFLPGLSLSCLCSLEVRNNSTGEEKVLHLTPEQVTIFFGILVADASV